MPLSFPQVVDKIFILRHQWRETRDVNKLMRNYAQTKFRNSSWHRKFTVELGTQEEGFTMPKPTLSIKQEDIQKGHTKKKGTQFCFQKHKERIEMEDFSSGDSTEDMKCKPHNRCDRENNQSCKHKGRPLVKFNTRKNLCLNNTDHLKVCNCET